EVFDGNPRHRVVVENCAPNIGRGEAGIPGRPEHEPSDVVEEVAVGEASPVEDSLEARAVSSYENVAVDEVEVEHVLEVRARVGEVFEGVASCDKDAV